MDNIIAYLTDNIYTVLIVLLVGGFVASLVKKVLRIIIIIGIVLFIAGDSSAYIYQLTHLLPNSVTNGLSQVGDIDMNTVNEALVGTKGIFDSFMMFLDKVFN